MTSAFATVSNPRCTASCMGRRECRTQNIPNFGVDQWLASLAKGLFISKTKTTHSYTCIVSLRQASKITISAAACAGSGANTFPFMKTPRKGQLQGRRVVAVGFYRVALNEQGLDLKQHS
jgi:hypothetical protein